MIHKAKVLYARFRLRGRSFSVVTNNCWGAHLYQTLGLQYATPFVGLFFSPEAYLNLLAQFPDILDAPLSFRTKSEEEWINKIREESPVPWPIGVIGGVEIQFMHYKSEVEAADSWKRRSARFSRDPQKWFFKFCDRDGCTPEQALRFGKLPFANKVFFTSREEPGPVCAIRIPSEGSQVPDGLLLSSISSRHCNLLEWLLRGGIPRKNRGRFLSPF